MKEVLEKPEITFSQDVKAGVTAKCKNIIQLKATVKAKPVAKVEFILYNKIIFIQHVCRNEIMYLNVNFIFLITKLS